MKSILSKIKDSNGSFFRFLLFFLTLVIILALFPKQVKFKYEFTKGKPWLHESIIAPFDFSILKSKNELKREREIIRSQHLPIYNYSERIFEIKIKDFINDYESKWTTEKGIEKDIKFTFKDLFKNKSKLANTQKNNLANFGYNFLKDIYSTGIIQVDYSHDFHDLKQILLKSETIAERRNVNDFYTIRSAAEKVNLISTLSNKEYEFLTPLLLAAIKENILFDKLATNKLLSNELSDISTKKGLILSGQVVIKKGEIVDSEKFQVLYSLKQRYEGVILEKSSYLLVFVGQFMLVGISLLILWLFLKQYRREILEKTNKLYMILSLILIMVFVSSIISSLNSDWIYCIPFCVSPIILKMFFDNRVALFVHLITILIIGFIMPNGFEFVFLQLVAGIICILTIVKMYKRAQLFMSVIKVTMAYLFVYIAFTITHNGSMDGIQSVKLLQFTISGALTIFAYPIVFVFEKLFSLLSDVSLLELSDTNSPLLRRLSDEAPGTFQHSLQVANLAEMGALKVGANAILIRAGALYHDIGKLNHPMYFIENQISILNPHDNIDFDESAEIIIKHVLDGIKIARQDNLPDELIDFIRTHHGTTTVEYFYKQYIANFPDKEVDRKNFTYPGPKPFSKETAILMMADSSEASVRSIKNPTSENIHNLIEMVINKQIEDEQFIESDITLREITQLKELFKKQLVNVHHTRIEY